MLCVKNSLIYLKLKSDPSSLVLKKIKHVYVCVGGITFYDKFLLFGSFSVQEKIAGKVLEHMPIGQTAPTQSTNTYIEVRF